MLNSPPSGAVTISGIARRGETLIADASGVSDVDGIDESTVTYQWLRYGEIPISGATGSTYVLTQNDVYEEVAVRFSYTDNFGTRESVTSAKTSTVENGNYAPSGTVVISGIAQQGETLTADASSVTDADGIDASTVAYQWLRDGVAISGATGTSYTLTQDDVGAAITYAYSFTDDFGNPEQVTSAATAAVANVNDPATGAPVISGLAQQGETLTFDVSRVADLDGIDGSTTSGQWLRDGAAIAGATGTSYTLTQDDVGAAITYAYSFTDDFGTPEQVTSAATDPVASNAVNLIGTPGADTLVGTDGDDTIQALDGADRINGAGGNDQIFGGETDADLRDVIFAGAGDDYIEAGAGNDLVYGMDGNDTIAGGAGVDELQGQDGDDVITGSNFSDLVFGGAGNDFVNGGFGSDRVNGGSGADKFFHVGVEGHGSDWVQDYNAAEGDVLLFGNSSATRDRFQVNFAHTENAAGERSGDDAVQEAFVIYRPTGQILWALIDGEGQSSINLQIGSDVFDLLA
ncbi:calcium-binding protein [Ruegeria sp. PrR005]|uniref:Calcium-binding protein n=2 Tax=Ruegeria sp. PrR005 TaxID=2706882 RepID=A0A6B2NUI6_9RHOB|nr:calcium-binding protein [Ruegeria sp. PrR005]